MPWWAWPLVLPVVAFGGLWLGASVLFQRARRGVKRRWFVPVPARGIVAEVDIYVGHWLSRVWPSAAVAMAGAIWLRYPGDGYAGSRVTPTAALVHELMHAVVQAPRMGWRYLPTYLWQRVALRRSWARHRMEREAVRLTDAWLAGDRTVLGDLPATLAAAFPHRRIG